MWQLPSWWVLAKRALTVPTPGSIRALLGTLARRGPATPCWRLRLAHRVCCSATPGRLRGCRGSARHGCEATAGEGGLAGPHPWSCSPARPLPTQRDGRLRREVTGVLPPLLVSAPGHAEVHGPVGHLGEGRVSRAAPRSGPRLPAARGSPRPTAGTAASCRPSYTPAARRRHSTCTGRWAGP